MKCNLCGVDDPGVAVRTETCPCSNAHELLVLSSPSHASFQACIQALLRDNDALRAALALERDGRAIEREVAKAAMDRVEEREATIARLNRRAQAAESAARATVDECERKGTSYGRELANWYAAKLLGERDALKDALAALVSACEDGGWTEDREREAIDDLGEEAVAERQPWKALREARRAMGGTGEKTKHPQALD